MKDFIISLFGVYEPVTYRVTECLGMTSEGVPITEVYEVVASGAAGLDWPWLMGVGLFAIVLYSLFRILGVCFK